MKLCTTIEQSKRILELGIDKKTSDLFYWCGGDLRIGGYLAQDPDFDVPAWSVAALLNLIMLDCKIEKTPINQGGDFIYNICYKDIVTKGQEDLVDACVEMLERLKEIDLLP